METKPESAHEKSLPSVPTGARTSQLSLTIAPKAAEMARKQLTKRGTPDAMIRLGIRGAGCSGFTYVIEFEDKEPRDRDRVFEPDGGKFVVDKK